MDRKEAVALLEKAGYVVDDSGSVMTVLIPEEQRKELGKVSDKITKMLRTAGYDSSFGVKPGKKMD